MVLTKHALKLIGFEEHDPPKLITCTFMVVKVYSLKSITLREDTDAQVQSVNSKLSFGVGNDVNQIGRLLFNDDFVEETDEWFIKNKDQKPFLMTLTTLPSPSAVHCKMTIPSEERITTYESFGAAKTELESLVAALEVPAVLRMCASLAKEDHVVTAKHVKTIKFGRTSDGRYVDDIRFSGRANVTTAYGADIPSTMEIMRQAAQKLPNLGERVPRLAYAGQQEADPIKKFLFSWTALEALIGKVFAKTKAVDFPIDEIPTEMEVHINALFQDPARGRRITTVIQRFAYLVLFDWKFLNERDYRNFCAIKKIRDDFTHGDPVDLNALPIDPLAQLLSKVIANY